MNYPQTLISIKLLKEKMTRDRSYTLRRLSDTKWATAYLDIESGAFYYGHYFNSLEDASKAFNEEINRQMKRFNHFTKMFFKHRDYIVSAKERTHA